MFPKKEYFSEKNKQLRQSHFASFCFEIALACALLRCRLSVRGVWWHRFLWKFNDSVVCTRHRLLKKLLSNRVVYLHKVRLLIYIRKIFFFQKDYI